MRGWRRLVLVATLLASSGCVTRTLQENAALRAMRPQPPAELSAYVAPREDFPSVGGDILRGTSPADLAAARAAAVAPLAADPAIPNESPH
jgi:hypothetical protein